MKNFIITFFVFLPFSCFAQQIVSAKQLSLVIDDALSNKKDKKEYLILNSPISGISLTEQEWQHIKNIVGNFSGNDYSSAKLELNYSKLKNEFSYADSLKKIAHVVNYDSLKKVLISKNFRTKSINLVRYKILSISVPLEIKKNFFIVKYYAGMTSGLIGEVGYFIYQMDNKKNIITRTNSFFIKLI